MQKKQELTPEAELICANKIEKYKNLFQFERKEISQHTFRAVQIPPEETSPGPRVEHISIFASGQLSEIIANELNAPKWFILELIRFGAVYYCPIMPHTNVANFMEISEDKKHALYQIYQAGVQLHGPDPKLTVARRVQEDMVARVGSYCRVHVHPKRFPMVYKVEWISRIILETEQLVVINKPRGVQVPPTVDNILESAIANVATAINFEGQLLNVHRLDRETEGIVLLAKSSEFASTVQQRMMGSMQKIYKALTKSAPVVGQLQHYLKVGQRQQGEPYHTHVFDNPTQGATESRLIIQKVEEVQLTGEAQDWWGDKAFECTILLLTGRTHQIRAQLAHIDCPLLGDALYNSKQCDNTSLETQNLKLQDTGVYALQAHEMVINHEGAILQCEDPLRLRAGVPWWRDSQQGMEI